jgi:hypothetical protein
LLAVGCGAGEGGSEHADRIVIDLHPGDGIEWQEVVETALELRAMRVPLDLGPERRVGALRSFFSFS